MSTDWDGVARRYQSIKTCDHGIIVEENGTIYQCDRCEEESVVRCYECRIEKPEDAAEYNAINLVYNAPPGWYSGSDGELCGACMTKMFKQANGLT